MTYMIDDFWVSKEASGPLPILVKDLCFDPKRYCLNIQLQIVVFTLAKAKQNKMSLNHNK